MNHPKRIIQIIFLFLVIWLTIQNYSAKVTLNIFNKEITDASVILVVFFSVILGAMITALVSSFKELKRSSEQRKLIKENKKQLKDIELLQKDLKIVQNDLEKLNLEITKKDSEIKTLKDIISMPNISDNNNYQTQHLID